MTVDVGRIVTEPPAETIPLAEAQAQLPFELNLPSGVPDGFVLQDEVEAVLPTEDWPYGDVTVTWLNADDAAFTLQVTNTPQLDSEFVGGGQTESVTVNGQPAALARLGLKSAPRQLTLTWAVDDLRYTLETGGDVLTDAELINVAEAIP